MNIKLGITGQNTVPVFIRTNKREERDPAQFFLRHHNYQSERTALKYYAPCFRILDTNHVRSKHAKGMC